MARQHGKLLQLDDVVGPELPDLDEVLAAIRFRFERVSTASRLTVWTWARALNWSHSRRDDAGPRSLAKASAFGAVSSVWEH